VFCYTELARQLGPGQAFYGLQARGLDGTRPPLTDLGEMAAHYVEAVRGVQPEGPYLLGGWSMGGVVAFEMARLIRERGDRVAYLALIDSRAGGEAASAKGDAELLFDLALQMGAAEEQLQPLRARFAARRPADVFDAFCEEAGALGLLPAALGPAQVRALLEVYRANHRVLLDYTPGRYAGTVTLFEAAGTAADPRFDAALGWRPYVSGGVEVHEVPGSHFTIMREPHVGELARLLREGIAEDRSALQHTQC
jgi:thioesterase domain-containing protein